MLMLRAKMQGLVVADLKDIPVCECVILASFTITLIKTDRLRYQLSDIYNFRIRSEDL